MCSFFGRSWWEREHCSIVNRYPPNLACRSTIITHLECSPHTENTVVGLLWRKALQGKENGLGLFRDQIIGPAQGHVSELPMYPNCSFVPSSNPLSCLRQLLRVQSYLRPSFLYPAASVYQLERGINHLFSHGRLMTWLTRDGCDMVKGVFAGGGGVVGAQLQSGVAVYENVCRRVES